MVPRVLEVLIAHIPVLLHVQVLDGRLDLLVVTLADTGASVWTYEIRTINQRSLPSLVKTNT